jgi:uncharacterized protein (DUF302 family)
MRKFMVLLLFLSALGSSAQASDALYSRDIKGGFERIYRDVYTGLEKAGFHVVYEAYISNALAKHADEWGREYNKNGIEVVRSMVICSPWYANQLLNQDPKMIAVCPINVTVTYKQGTATVLFKRLATIGAGSPALGTLQEMDEKIIGVIAAVSAG